MLNQDFKEFIQLLNEHEVHQDKRSVPPPALAGGGTLRRRF